MKKKRHNNLETVKKASSPTRIALQKFVKNKIAMASLIFLILVAIISIIAPLLAPLPINQQDLLNIKGDMTSQNILGTDSGGRDNFSRLLYAGRSRSLLDWFQLLVCC